MKALLFIAAILLVLLLAGQWVGSGSYPDRWRMEQEITVQEKSNKEQKDKNRRIQAELDDVASGSDAIEERARSELGMTKKGETFYEVILQPEVKDEPVAAKLSAKEQEKQRLKKPMPFSAPLVLPNKELPKEAEIEANVEDRSNSLPR